MNPRDYFAVIVGSGFSGSLLSWILQKHGKDILILDRDSHPRFAIGESTTPTADFFIRHLADRWGLSELRPFSAYGSWIRTYPHVTCGKKRGFAYYAHQPHTEFFDDEKHARSLLVAASSSDESSDTHWYRSEVDHWIYSRALECGVRGFENTQLETAEFDRSLHQWRVQLRLPTGKIEEAKCRWMIDASGGSRALRSWFGTHEDSDWMRTRTGTVFGHFRGIAPFASQTRSFAEDAANLFDGDDSAQHHVIEKGWFWTLRFCNQITSFGVVVSENDLVHLRQKDQSVEYWRETLDRYPSIARMLHESHLVDPTGGLRLVHRMSRCNDRAVGPGWVSLPVAFGFIDPLHSTGIAHALSGVARLSEAFIASNDIDESLQSYGQQLRKEIEWLDTIVGICYRGLPSFQNFIALASFYFAAAIGFERDVARDPTVWPRGYMLVDESGLKNAAEKMFQSVSKGTMDEIELARIVRQCIDPWNPVGLLDPRLKNRLAHTVAPKEIHR